MLTMKADKLQFISRRLSTEFYFAVDILNAKIDKAKTALKELRRVSSTVAAEFQDTSTSVASTICEISSMTKNLARLKVQDETDAYLERLMENLVQFGRNIQLAIYYLEPRESVQYRETRSSESKRSSKRKRNGRRSKTSFRKSFSDSMLWPDGAINSCIAYFVTSTQVYSSWRLHCLHVLIVIWLGLIIRPTLVDILLLDLPRLAYLWFYYEVK